MKIKLTSVQVDDQDKALRFYTEVLGFTKKADFSSGSFRWLTVSSPEEPDCTSPIFRESLADVRFTSGATAASARQRCVRPDCAQRDPELGDADPAPQNRTPANPIPA